VAELITNAPEGTLFYKFDPTIQGWASVNQFEFGAWAQPEQTLSPGDAVHVIAVTNFQVKFSGTIPTNTAFPELKEGWSLLSLPVPEVTALPTPGDGDLMVWRDPATSTFLQSYGTNGTWELTPGFRPGQGFWYFRNSTNVSLTPTRGYLYFNNYVPYYNINARFLRYDGCAGLAGTNYLVQVYAGYTASSLVPITPPQSFLSTPAGTGYFDTRSGGLLDPYVTTDREPFVQIVFWDARTGARSYQEATSSGMGQIWQVMGGRFAGHPFVPFPAPLRGIQGLLEWPAHYQIWSHPTNTRAFLGNTTRLTVSVGAAWPPGFFYQWQKSLDGILWTDLPFVSSNSFTSEYVIPSVAPEDAGNYRAIVWRNCLSQTSNPAVLQVYPPPSLTEGTNQGRSFLFKLNGESGFNYRLEYSAMLPTWSGLRVISNAELPQVIVDTNAFRSRYRFYRAVVLDP
jgi:hypothetical protein